MCFYGVVLKHVLEKQCLLLLTTSCRFQVAHFITPFNYDSLDRIHAALNGLLPADIRVREISPAVPDFHARYIF